MKSFWLLFFVLACQAADELASIPPQKPRPTFVAEDSLKVLFIGNSLSFSYDMPSILERIGREEGKAIETDCLCLPNYALIDHWNDRSIHERLEKSSYDLLLLQQGPSSQEEGRALLLDGGRRIARLADQQDHPTVVGFYMVWPSDYYYYTFDGVIQSYRLAASQTQSEIYPVGEVFRAFRSEVDDSWYGEDLFHPSKKGAFMVAYSLYRFLYPDARPDFFNAYKDWLSREEFVDIRGVFDRTTR